MCTSAVKCARQQAWLLVFLATNSNVLCAGETEQPQEAGQEGGEASQKGSAALEKRSKAFQRGNAAPQEHSTAAFQENGEATQESGRRHQEVIKECVVEMLDRWALPCPEGLLASCLLKIVWMQAHHVEGIDSDMTKPVMWGFVR